MEQDQRLTPLPTSVDVQSTRGDYPPAYSPFYDDEAMAHKRSLRQYANIVYKRLPLILAIAILVTTAVAFYSFRQPSIYQAQTEMIIEARKPQVTSKDSINISFGDDTNYYNTQLQLLQNADLMKKVVIALGLYHDPHALGDPTTGFVATLRNLFGVAKKPDADNTLPVLEESPVEAVSSGKIDLTPEEDALASKYAATLVGGLKVERLESTNLVTITVQNQNPELAAKVADKMAEIFIEDDANSELEGAKSAYTELTRSIEDLKVAISNDENEEMSQQQHNGLPLQDKGADLRAANLTALQTQLNQAQSDSSKAQATYSAAMEARDKGDILSVVGENKAIQDARSENLKRQADLEKRVEDVDNRIKAAQEEKEKLLVRYTAEYKDVREKDAQIQILEAQKVNLNQEVAAKIKADGDKLEKNAEREVLTSLKAQYDAATQREAKARASYDQAATQANAEGQAETRLITLKRQIETNRTLLDTYTQRQKEQELAITGNRPNNIKISNRAVTPGGPIGPNRFRNILMALLVSISAGIGLAFLMDYLDDSVRTSDDIGRHLGLPTLALIPHYIVGDRKKLAIAPTTNGNGNGNGNGGRSDAALITLSERQSPMAEAYRHLRTSLLFSSAGKPPQTILITSAQPSEGKTTTAINTAITLAQSDADVVIIDCDLRRPRLHSHFSVENTQGLTNYLSGEKSTENLIKSWPDLPRLKIITSGPIPPNPAELLSSNEMKNLLQFLRGRFKHIVIDTPPAISFTDAAIMSTQVDGVVLVAMANKSSIHLMRQFKQRLGTIGARIYGVVLNGIKSGSMEYDYYGTGYYEYYKHADGDDSTPIMEDTQVHKANN